MSFQGICELLKIVSVSKKVYMVPIYIHVHFQGKGSKAVIALSNRVPVSTRGCIRRSLGKR